MSKIFLMLFSPVIGFIVGFMIVVLFHVKYLTSKSGSWWYPNHNAYLGLISLITANALLIMADPEMRIYSDFIMFLIFYSLGVMLTIPSKKFIARRLAALGLYITGVTTYISHLYGGRSIVPALTFAQLWLYQNRVGMNITHLTSALIFYIVGGIVIFVGIRFAISRDDLLTESLIVSGYSLLGSYMYLGGRSLPIMLLFALLFGVIVYGLSELMVLLVWSFTGIRLED